MTDAESGRPDPPGAAEKPVRVVVPSELPELTPAVARTLLKILRELTESKGKPDDEDTSQHG